MLDVKNLVTENALVARKAASAPDPIDERIARWLLEVPELDAETEGIVDRISLLARYLERTHGETLEQFGLSWGEVKVMGSLRYAGPPYRSTPSRLARELDLSSGAMTTRLDRMEEAELIRRLDDPDDRRGVIVELTERGHDLWRQSVAVQAEKETAVAGALGDAEKRRLNDLLRTLVHAFRDAYGPLKRH